MPSHADAILHDLQRVTEERRRRAADASLSERVRRLKAYQQARFSHTYVDLLQHPRYEAASRFFLVELYGPSDFSRRDEQFARVVPAMVRLFPTRSWPRWPRWRRCMPCRNGWTPRWPPTLARPTHSTRRPIPLPGRRRASRRSREQQIALTVQVGERLDRLTRNPLLRHSLRMMRGPARAAGLNELQHFIESGFDTFRAMRGAKEFLALIGDRERRLAAALFAAQPPFDAASSNDWLPRAPD